MESCPYLGAAAWWFRIALAVLAALALMVATYALVGPEPPDAATKSSDATAQNKTP